MAWSKDKQFVYMKKYYAENRESILAKNKLWREANKELHLRRAREYHHENRERLLPLKRAYTARTKDRRAHLLRLKKYGITADGYAALLKAQNECCAICSEKASLVVDHNHETGKVRGLLCNPCNQAIGLLKEDASRFRSAVKYLGLA